MPIDIRLAIPSLAIQTAAPAENGTGLATGDQIFDFVTTQTTTTAADTTGNATSATLAATATTVVASAITLPKLANGTAGNLITYAANGAPAAVATGTAAHVLTSGGVGVAPTFQVLPAGTSGTVTSVTAGAGMTQAGTSTVDPTLNVIATTNANAIKLKSKPKFHQ